MKLSAYLAFVNIEKRFVAKEKVILRYSGVLDGFIGYFLSTISLCASHSSSPFIASSIFDSMHEISECTSAPRPPQ